MASKRGHIPLSYSLLSVRFLLDISHISESFLHPFPQLLRNIPGSCQRRFTFAGFRRREIAGYPSFNDQSKPTVPIRSRSFIRYDSAFKLNICAWCKSRSSIAVATASSDIISAHLENGLFDVRIIEPVS